MWHERAEADRDRRSLPRWWPLMGSALLLAAAAGCRSAPRPEPGLRMERVGGTPALATEAPAPSATRDPGSVRRTAIVEAVGRVAPAVVSINVTSRERVAPRTPWDMFFVPEGSERVVQGFGTGIIVRPDGVIVTNQHVVAGAEKIVVTLTDGRDFPGHVLGEDPTTDIAVVKIDASGLPVAPLGRSTDLMTGEWVVALGNPYAYMLGNAEPTVTVGVVSATGRNIVPTGDQPGLYLDMIQTDAAINPGNSGGPLANALGDVVGVNSSILSNTNSSIGLGFAIPIERAVRVADEIVRTGAVRRAWTGLQVAGAESLADWRTHGGVPVTTVAPGGPADRAGVRVGDVLTRAAGRPLRNYLDWEAVKLDLRVGDPVTVTDRRGDLAIERRIVTGDLPSVAATKVNVLQGLQLVTVTPAVRAERNLQSAQGALIFKISPAVAQATGLTEGNVILALNRTRIADAQQFADLVRRMPPRQPFRVYFERGGAINFTDLVF